MYPYSNDDYYEPKTIIQQPQIKHDSLIDGVAVPGLQCLITGVLSGLAVGTLAAWMNGNGWRWGFGSFVVLTFLSWIWYRQGWNDRLERMLGIDMNRDGRIGPLPPPPVSVEPEKVTIELVQNRGQIGQRGDEIDLPYPDKLPAFAQQVLEGRAYSQSVLVGTGKLFSRPEYDALINALVTGGLMRWKNPDHHNVGAVPTLAGRAVLKHFLPAPSPAGKDGE